MGRYGWALWRFVLGTMSAKPIASTSRRTPTAIISLSFDPKRIKQRLSESPQSPLGLPTRVSSSPGVDRRQIVRRHLAQYSTTPPTDSASNIYTRQGTDTTYDIYKWADNDASRHRRRAKSISNLPLQRELSTSDIESISQRSNSSRVVAARDLRVPGAFRRHHIRLARTHSQVIGDGDDNNDDEPFTQSFIDFLALYGHFAGEEYLEDWEEDELAERSILEQVSGETQRALSPNTLATLGERAPLLQPLSPRPTGLAKTTPSLASSRKIFLLLLKSFIGTGVLFLPRAIHSGGLVFSIAFLCFVSLLSLHSMLLLIECRKSIPGSFGDIGGHLYGKWMRRLVRMSIFTSQLGFTCAYTIFVARNLRDVISLTTNCKYQPRESTLILAQFFIYTPLALIRKIKQLSSVALIADVFILLGLVYLCFFDVVQLMRFGIAPGVRFVSGPEMSVFIGTAVYTFEGIGLLIPIVEGMKKPEKFPSLLTITMVIVTLVFCLIGSLSYITFGKRVETVVLQNLPADNAAVVLLQFIYTLAILFSVPLQLFPVIGIVEQALFKVRSGRLDPRVKWRKNFLRSLITALAMYIAFVGSSNFDKFVSLIGSFACVPLSFIYPAMFHYKAMARTRWQLSSDLAIVIFGVIVMAWTTYMTLKSWVQGDVEVPSNRCDVIPP